MVQGEGSGKQGSWSIIEKDQDSKRIGFMSLQSKCHATSQKTSQQALPINRTSTENKNASYGVWGPQLRNADYFKKLHNF